MYFLFQELVRGINYLYIDNRKIAGKFKKMKNEKKSDQPAEAVPEVQDKGLK